jgi:CRISPR/Cas system-associated endonuclease Cas3-HD
MSLEEFKIGLSEQYQGEVIGEVFFCRMLERFTGANERYKLASFLQLETETKARLRPAALELGVDLVERDESRDRGIEFYRSLEGMDWKGAMKRLAAIAKPFVKRYREIAEIAPAEYKDLAHSMVVHEMSIETAAELEARGECDHSMDQIVEQLKYPLRNLTHR